LKTLTIKETYKKLVAITLLLLILFGCAAQGPPSGGPKDTTGPELISVKPETGTLNFPINGNIEFVFSEPISPRSAENSLIVRPSLESTPIVHVRRNKIQVKFTGNLKENTTYILSFGRNIKDYRDNAIDKNIQLAFSTGQNFSRAEISGFVFNVKEGQYCKVMAWNEDNFNPDSITYIAPDYITATDQDGNFKLSHLKSGHYFLLAAASSQNIRNISSRYEVGIPNRIPIYIKTDSTKINHIHFNITDYDLLTPFNLKSAETKDIYINCLFSHPVNQQYWDSIDVKIDAVTIHNIWRDDIDKNTIKILTDSLPFDSAYSVKFAEIYNQREERLLSEKGRAKFIPKTRVDSTGPSLQSSAPSSGNQRINPASDITINFTEPIYNIDPKADIALIKTDDSSKIGYDYNFIDDNSIHLKPDSNLKNHTEYLLFCKSDPWQDFKGNKYVDSTFSINFTTWDPREFGYMSGKLQLGEQINYERIILKAQKLDGEYADLTRADSTGAFRFNRLFPGEYKVAIWQDTNQDNRYFPGSLYPVRPAEDYIMFQQKIEIRARWETAGIILK